MKTKASFIFLMILLISSSIFGQEANFTGEWKLNREKSVQTNNQIFLSRINIKLKSGSLLTSRVYENANGEEYFFDENLSLDEKGCKIVIYEMPRTTKATRSNTERNLVIESTTTFNGNNGEENLIAKETRKVDNDGKTITIDFSNKKSGGETTGTNYYNKIR